VFTDNLQDFLKTVVLFVSLASEINSMFLGRIIFKSTSGDLDHDLDDLGFFLCSDDRRTLHENKLYSEIESF